MRPVKLELTMETADRNGISVSQTIAGAGNLTITGAYATDGVATLDVARHVSVYAAADESLLTFTITGTDRHGVALEEAITGPTAGATVKSEYNFLTVTQIAVSAAGSGAIEVGTANELESKVIPLDWYGEPISYDVSLSSGASLTWEFLYTLDSPFDHSFHETTAKWHSDSGTQTGDVAKAASGRITACRIAITNFTSGTATSHIITPAHR